jgi:hypothetical protein
MSATTTARRIAAFALIAACPSALSAVGFVPREYHGKTQFCMTSRFGSQPWMWGITTSYERVFTGTVKSATEVGDVEKRVQLVPNEVFVGDAGAVTAIGNQACLGTEIQVGQNWLVYLFRDKRRNELVLDWQRSTPIQQAQKDVSILRHLAKMPDSGIVTGRVGLAGHKILATRASDRKEFSAVSDASGNYELDLLEGNYFLTANTTRGLWAPETEIRVSAQDCTQLDFWFHIDGRIAGTVETADGKLATYVQVAIVPLSPAGESFTVTTNGEGHFEVGGRQPGQYLVGVGILAPEDSSEWKTRVYYPGVPAREQAHVVELSKGEWRTDISFMLAPRTKSP